MAVSIPPKESYFLYVIPNPISACRVAMYKEHFVKTPAGWIPDRLTELVRLPDFGVIPDPDDGVEGQTTRVYLLDLWLPPNADVARFRLEVQLKMGDWTIRPMEVRVMEARFPDVPSRPRPPPPRHRPRRRRRRHGSLGRLSRRRAPRRCRLPADNAAESCGATPSRTWRSPPGRAGLAQRVLDLFRVNTAFTPPIWGAEWWLRLRDWLYNRP